MAERHALFDSIFVGRMYRRGSAKPTAAFRVLALQQVPLAGARTEHFSSRGDLKPLGGGLLRFDAFGTSHKAQFLKKERAI